MVCPLHPCLRCPDGNEKGFERGEGLLLAFVEYWGGGHAPKKLGGQEAAAANGDGGCGGRCWVVGGAAPRSGAGPERAGARAGGLPGTGGLGCPAAALNKGNGSNAARESVTSRGDSGEPGRCSRKLCSCSSSLGTFSLYIGDFPTASG